MSKHSVKVAAVIVMSGILLSRILGYVRLMLTANIFGTGMEADAFTAAFTFPDAIYNLLIGGTLSAAFIPVFTSYLAKEKEEEGWRVASNFINIISMSLFAFTILGIIFAPYLVPLVASGYQGDKLLLTIKLTRIMFTAVSFTSLAGLGIGILNSYQRFTVTFLGPVVYNLGIIISLLIAKKFGLGITEVAYGVVISAMINFLVQFAALIKKLKFYSPILDPKQDELIKIFKLAIPTILGLSIIQINLIINQTIASSYPGSVAAYNYANTIMSLPVGIFAMGMATAIFPTLTRQIALDKITEFKETFSLGLRTTFFVTIPCAVGLAILREPVIRLLFLKGRFTEHDVKVTSYALLFFCLGIVFQSGVYILSRGFYSVQDTKTPVKIGFVSIVINVVTALLITNFGLNYFTYPIGGLTFAFSVASIINMTSLFVIFNKRIKGMGAKRVANSFVKSALASTVMGLGVYFTYIYASSHSLFNIATKLGQAYEVLSLVLLGGLIFTAFAIIFKMEEMKYVASLIKNKLRLAGNNN